MYTHVEAGLLPVIIPFDRQSLRAWYGQDRTHRLQASAEVEKSIMIIIMIKSNDNYNNYYLFCTFTYLLLLSYQSDVIHILAHCQ